MNQALGNSEYTALFSQSATGDAIPNAASMTFVRSAVPAAVPVRFTVIEYGDFTRQAYDGNDRAKADQAWASVHHGIYLGATAHHVNVTLGKR